MTFVRDTTAGERVFRALTVVDDFTREALVIEADTSLGGARVFAAVVRLTLTSAAGRDQRGQRSTMRVNG